MWKQILEKMTAQILLRRKYTLIAVLLELPWQEDAKTSVCSNQPQPNPFQPVKPRRGAWGIGAWRLPSLCLQLPGVLLHLPEHRHLRLLPHYRHHLDGRQLSECFLINSLSRGCSCGTTSGWKLGLSLFPIASSLSALASSLGCSPTRSSLAGQCRHQFRFPKLSSPPF